MSKIRRFFGNPHIFITFQNVEAEKKYKKFKKIFLIVFPYYNNIQVVFHQFTAPYGPRNLMVHISSDYVTDRDLHWRLLIHIWANGPLNCICQILMLSPHAGG